LRDPHQLYETLGRLTALLGKDRVGTPVLEETHRPDAFRVEPFSWQLGETGAVLSHYSLEATECIPPIPSALRRFRPNLSARVLLDKDKPAYIRSVQLEGEISAQRGPYALSGDWWDEARWSRREWDVQLTSGTVARCHQTENGWALDGIYD
jgi:protein ImuB